MKQKMQTLLTTCLIICASTYQLHCQAAAIPSNKINSFDHNFSIGADFGWGIVGAPTSRERRVAAGYGSNLLQASPGSKAWGMRIAYTKPYDQKWSYGGEIGYDDFGSSQVTYSSLDQYAFSEQSYNLLAVAKYNLNQQWGLIAKAGAAITLEQYQNVVRVASTPDYYSAKRTVFPMLKGGVTLQVNQKVQLIASYSYIFGNQQKFISQAFGKLNPSISPDILTTVAGASSINVGFNIAI